MRLRQCIAEDVFKAGFVDMVLGIMLDVSTRNGIPVSEFHVEIWFQDEMREFSEGKTPSSRQQGDSGMSTDCLETCWSAGFVESDVGSTRHSSFCCASACFSLYLDVFFGFMKNTPRRNSKAKQRYRFDMFRQGACCPEKDKTAGLVLPHVNMDAMGLHLAEISRKVDACCHAVVVLDRASWHTTEKLDIPSNVSLLPLPPWSFAAVKQWYRLTNCKISKFKTVVLS